MHNLFLPFYVFGTGTTTTKIQPDRIPQLQALLASLQAMLTQHSMPSVHPANIATSFPQFTASQFPYPSFLSNITFGDGTSQQEPPFAPHTTIHDLVNRTLAQMTPLANEETRNWDFLQHNPLFDSYACASVPNQLTHLKLDTYDGFSDPTQYMLRFTIHMYAYNASNSTCCRMFPSSLIGKALVWYTPLPP